MARKLKNLIGNIYNSLTVIDRLENDKYNKPMWKCRCNCGNESKVSSSNLKFGGTKNCKKCVIRPSGSSNLLWTSIGKMSGYFYASIKDKAKRRNLEFSLSKEELYSYFEIQEEKCALTGVKLTFNIRKNKDYSGTASVDRIDSSKGYVKGNVQWVCKDINFAKQSLSQKDFIKMCELVANYNKKIIKF